MNKPSHENGWMTAVDRTIIFPFSDTADVLRYHQGASEKARYARYENATCEQAEIAIAKLDCCEEAALYASGMAAISNTLIPLLCKGDHLVLQGKGYRNIAKLANLHLPRFDIETTAVALDPVSTHDPVDALLQACRPNTKVVFVEVPTNPHLWITDIRRLRSMLSPKITLIVDSTLGATNIKPAQLGADLVIHSLGKFVAGYNDLMLGSVAGSSRLIQQIRDVRHCFGNIINPDAAWLLLRSLQTLPIRMERINSSAQKIAEWLEQQSSIPCRKSTTSN